MANILPKYDRHWVRWGNGTGTHAYLLDLVGFNKAVLEIGCSTGYLSSVMQQRGCQVTGVEIDEAVAKMARPFCRRVIVGDAEKLEWKTVLGDERFDVITFGDVLEHMRAPEAVLRQLCHHLAPDGYIVVSLPNIAHGSVRLSLLLGRFEYAPLGILDKTHLRFYTKETAQQLLASSGFRVEEVLPVNEQVSPDLISEVLNRFPQLTPDWIQGVLSREDAQTFQYVFRAVPATRQTPPQNNSQVEPVSTLSVVICHHGSDEAGFLSCLAALSADGIPLRQIIVIAESEPALLVLEGESPSVEWEWQARQPDEGDVHALNRALTSVAGDVALILDSRLVPQAGALRALVGHFRAGTTVGVVGGKILAPDGCTILQAGVYLSPPVARVAYRGAGHQDDDEQWNDVAEVDFVSVAMMALRRSLWQSLGGFDEGYFGHYFGADFCARVWAAGYRVLVEPKALAISSLPKERSFDWLVGFHRNRLRFVRQHYGGGTWPEGFFEAESALLDEVKPELERHAMRLAYLWQLVEGESASYTETRSLLDLYQRVKISEAADLPMALPRLQVHRFSSSVPWLGRLIACFRAWWGSVAARWYAESLVRQQNLFNQIMSDRADDLLEQLSELEKLVVWLGTELANLRRERNQRVPFTDRDGC